MSASNTRRRLLGGGVAMLACLVCGAGVPAQAAGPPVIVETWSAQVGSTTARVQTKINPNESITRYRVDYILRSDYLANQAALKAGFAGAHRSPDINDLVLGSGTTVLSSQQLLTSLRAEATYMYRVVASNLNGVSESPALSFTTFGAVIAGLPDSRGWEQVSPADKNGGQVAPPEVSRGNDLFQAAADGQSVTYSSSASFAAGGQGAPPVSQYLSGRGAGGWSTQNIASPLYSGSFDFSGAANPFQLFSPDLARAVVLNGEHCRGEGGGCAVANPPLAGTDAPVGYQNYYLRDSGSGGFEALLGDANSGLLEVGPASFDLSFAGSSADLRHVIVSTCAALTATATEVPLGEGCNPAAANLYEFSPGAGLDLLNVKPAQSQGTPGATLAAPAGAVSADGSRVYWSQGGDLFLRAGGTTVAVAAAAQFQAASADGSVAFYTSGGHLFRYKTSGGSNFDLTPAGGVMGVLGASEDGSYVYYESSAGLFANHGAANTLIAAGGADASNYSAGESTARISSDGTRLVFLATDSLTGYDNADQVTGLPDRQVYLFSAAAGAGELTCLSCNPADQRPVGPSGIPGAGQSYRSRVLSADAKRIFFDSDDALVPTDTNGGPDVYEWEVQGSGSCTRAGGCVYLISGGRSVGGSTFVDASSSGADVFFVTEDSLVTGDNGAFDLYDARIGGGFASPAEPIPCRGDACQSLPSAPVDPTLTTLLPGLGNIAPRYPDVRKCKKGRHKRNGKCVHIKRKPKKQENRARAGGRR